MRSGLFLLLFHQLADPALVARLPGEAQELGWHGPTATGLPVAHSTLVACPEIGWSARASVCAGRRGERRLPRARGVGWVALRHPHL
jgi:hypothetical protein